MVSRFGDSARAIQRAIGPARCGSIAAASRRPGHARRSPVAATRSRPARGRPDRAPDGHRHAARSTRRTGPGSSTAPATTGLDVVTSCGIAREAVRPRLARHGRRPVRFRRGRRPRPLRGPRQQGRRRRGRLRRRPLALPQRRPGAVVRRLGAVGPPPHRLGTRGGRLRLRRRRRPRPLRRPARPRHPLAEPGRRDVPRRDRRGRACPTPSGASPPPGATTTATGGPTST